jgi:hypothetical protein
MSIEDDPNLTWSMLLAKWTDFAKASVAFPKTPDGDRWRAAVPSIINLQAVTLALRELDRLSPADRPPSRDKAALLIDRAAATIQSLWPDTPLHPELHTLIHDARAALQHPL